MDGPRVTEGESERVSKREGARVITGKKDNPTSKEVNPIKLFPTPGCRRVEGFLCGLQKKM